MPERGDHFLFNAWIARPDHPMKREVGIKRLLYSWWYGTHPD
ncbi:MAG: hypothetical protein ACETVU_01015 [Desulfatiglandales bacterium]